MKTLVPLADVEFAARAHRNCRPQNGYLATSDRGIRCVGRPDPTRPTGLALPLCPIDHVKWQAFSIRWNMPKGQELVPAIDRWLPGTMGGYSRPQYLLRDVEAEAWHRTQIRIQWRTRNDDRPTRPHGREYCRRAINGYRAWRDRLDARGR